MNALANGQCERIGALCKALDEARSAFRPTFGQYIGQTPKDEKDRQLNAAAWAERRLPSELVFRKEMQNTPPHILLTNHSMLEYLLIRPDDSPLFDGGRGKHWQFIVLDETHQYRGAKGMEMGRLVRRLKERLREGGRKDAFRCIATSATVSSGEDEEDKRRSRSLQNSFSENRSRHPVSSSENRNRQAPTNRHVDTMPSCGRSKRHFWFIETARTASCSTAKVKAGTGRTQSHWKSPCAGSTVNITTLAGSGTEN